ncbi:RNA polymerase sigma factor [Sphingobacterium faecale]|uniref:Sigma-70 family RNA polymerase sigma factor n=1 Tax=Sphingobacterium faecale TaxID=2803775 RepID=A0ABS1QXR1_9SPHI|nr:sigma-70 family RNA polymerase sigma factor [Sphingobacterium faecale]MBL1407210.1 sigma-70 family RNA polymerase sigma factor [Sphingobacterium faecale]
MIISETSLLAALKLQDKESLEILFKQLYRPLVMFAAQFLDTVQEAEDVVQEVFVKLWENKTFHQIHSRLYAYLYRSVKNACIDRIRQRGGVRFELITEDEEISNEEPIDEEQWNLYISRIYAEIDKLPARTQEIFRAVILEQKKYKEVASQLGVSVNTIKTTLSRAFSKLRERFKDDDASLYLLILMMERLVK